VTVAPVEYVVLAFPGNNFTGKVAPTLCELVESNTIRVLDLVFITKDERGDVDYFEYDEVDEFAAFAHIDGEVGGLIGNDDIDYVSEGLEPGSSVALLVWEDVWAAPLFTALLEAGGLLVEGGRVPHDLIESALSGLEPVG
jgi:Family of unknown function (DUF6325)